MDNIFDGLVISSPNDIGGISLVVKNRIFSVDTRSTTGLYIDDEFCIKAIQPQKIEISDYKNTKVISNEMFDDIHDVLVTEDGIYLVGTMRNIVVLLDKKNYDIKETWKIDGEDDSCHINCLSLLNGNVIYSTFGRFKNHRGYKGNTSNAGFVADLRTGNVIIDELSQPHSIISFDNKIILANSQEKELRLYDATGTLERIIKLDGYTRGIYIDNDIIFVGLSSSRNIQDISSVDTATIIALELFSFKKIGELKLLKNEIYDISKIKSKENYINFLLVQTELTNNQLEYTIDKHRDVLVENDKLKINLEEQSAIIANFKQEIDLIKKSNIWKCYRYFSDFLGK
jgi:hypothetical protein